MGENIQVSKYFRVALIIEGAVVLLIALLFLRPEMSVRYGGDSLFSDSAISLEGLFDVTEVGFYADNSIAENIEIASALDKYHFDSYKATIRYIANDASNTFALVDDKGNKITENVVLPSNEGDVTEYTVDLKTLGSGYYKTSIRYNGNGYLYVYGVEISETSHFKMTLLLVIIGISAVIDALLTLDFAGFVKRIAGNVDKWMVPYDGKVTMSPGLYKVIIIVFLVIAVALRLWKIGFVPGNGAINNDEAFSGYEAWSMLNYGYDSHGYVNPVYLAVWGSGMSALQSYVIMPFVALLGLSPLALRLPSALLGIFTVIAFYRLFVKREQDALGIIGLIAMAIIPWNVMTSRWGLDCDFYPAFVLFGTLFLLKAKDNSKCIMLSMLFYGLSLYCYAAPWIVMPFLVIGQGAYMLAAGKCRWDKWWTVGLLILGVIAFPLLLFVAVNVGIIPEIRTGFISIPAIDFRGGEVGIKNAARNLGKFWKVIVLQNDGLLWNSIGKIGIYYMISVVPVVIGMLSSIRALARKEEYRTLDGLMWIWFICGIVLAVNVDNNVNRSNIIHIPVIYFIALGIAAIVRLLYNSKARALIFGLAGVYVFYFVWFVSYYFGSYSEEFGEAFDKGLPEALEYAQALEHDKIHVDVSYPVVLFRAKVPTAEIVDPENNFWETHCTDEYRITYFQDKAPAEGDVYIGKTSEVSGFMEQYGLETMEFGYFTVGHY